jgi:hypothetical protein
MPNMGERKHMNTEDVNKKNKDEEKYTKNLITKSFTTHEHKDGNKSLKGPIHNQSCCATLRVVQHD